MTNRVLLVVFAIVLSPIALLGQSSNGNRGNTKQALNGGPYTVATLPGSVPKGTLVNVSDGSSSTDCTVGGGTTLVTCEWSGSVWAAFGGGSGGSVAWDAITNPAGNMALSMGTNTSIFSGTAATSQFFAWKNTTAAVVGTSQGSPILSNCGRAFHGSADVEDCMTLGELPGNGNDAAITFTLGHTGTSTGTVLLNFPGLTTTATATNNVYLGAGNFPSSGSSNIYVGEGNGKSGSSTSGNLFIGGGGQGRALSNSGANVMVGYQAGYSLSNGNSNVALGNNAGLAVGTGSYNIAIGPGTGATYPVGGSSDILIGQSINAPSTSTSNWLNIGTTIQGANANGTLVNHFVGDTKNLATAGSGSATTVLTIPLATLQTTGGQVNYTIVAQDGTNNCALSGTINFAGENSAGTYVLSPTAGTGLNQATACTAASTLTALWSLVSGTNSVTLQVTPTTSMTVTTFTITYNINYEGQTEPSAF